MRRTIAVVTVIAALAAAAAPAYAGKGGTAPSTPTRPPGYVNAANPPDDNAREPFTGAPTKVQVASVESDLVARRSRGFSRSRSDEFEEEDQEEVEGQEEVDGEQESECGAIGVAPLAIGGLGLAAYRRRRR
jgi:hypothetical protein